MPESPEAAAGRKRRARAAERRREAVTVLAIGEATCRYGAARLADGASPEEARETALFIAGELTAIAGALRRLTRLGPAERRGVARSLANLGTPTKAIAQQLGVDPRCVRFYLNGRQG
jgi:hypothetical protein